MKESQCRKYRNLLNIYHKIRKVKKMAQIKAEYEENKEFSEIAQQLSQKYPEVFSTLDVDQIKCVAITNKDRSEKSDVLWKTVAVPMPIRMDCPYGYYVVLHLSDWVELGQKHKAALVFDALQSIPTESDKEGRLNTHDLKGYGVSLRTLGLDFMEREDIPNLLTDSIKIELR